MNGTFNFEETDRVRKYLQEKELYFDFDAISAHQDGKLLYCNILIEWGDWKHEHGYCDYLMKELGYTKIGAIVTAEDGSDCFSAERCYLRVL